MNILPGSKIVGASGKSLVVDRAEGEILICGDRRIKLSAVVKVEPPEATIPLVVGDTVYYCGDRYWHQYRGIPLVLALLREGEWTAEKADGYYTTNLSVSELSRSPVDRPRFRDARSTRKGDWLKAWELDQRRRY
jgi:hypothetical protein